MTKAFVLGNGISRKELSLQKLEQAGIIYGCNALYREFTPTVLVSTDKPISTEIQESGYPLKNRHHTRRPMPDRGSRPVPEKYFGYSSGPIAVSLAAIDGHPEIYLVGFDMGPGPDKLFNNIYAGATHYKQPRSAPTYTGNWIKQIVTVVNDFPQQKFYRVQGDTTANITELEGLNNLKHMPMARFLGLLG
jgi:hypothetical protein